MKQPTTLGPARAFPKAEAVVYGWKLSPSQGYCWNYEKIQLQSIKLFLTFMRIFMYFHFNRYFMFFLICSSLAIISFSIFFVFRTKRYKVAS